MSTAADWFEMEAEFRQLCGDAQSQAMSEARKACLDDIDKFLPGRFTRARGHGRDGLRLLSQSQAIVPP